MKFNRILVANRGEIALRIIRAAKELGIETVSIFSAGDEYSLHTIFSDESVRIGEAPSEASYLNIPQIISAASVRGVDAIHPGYGFLAENPSFAEICEENGFKFIGPPARAIKLMGDKIQARKIAKDVDVPTIPGTDEPVDDLRAAKKVANFIGYPVILKAAAGGGGRGMRVVHDESELERLFVTAQEEARIAFGDNRIYIEKYIVKPRHIEVQILADSHGNVIHLGERECSIQRRHQKLIEEAPSPAVTPQMRMKIGEYAVRIAKAIGYESAGTVEFLMDEAGNFYFMEMNTRVQVEHPVTEMVTGIDIVKEQIRIAEGEPLKYRQQDIEIRGHAIECRINAEDPERDFAPNPGEIKALYFPGGPYIRVDSHIYSGYKIPPHYDSLIAKLIAYGETRDEAIKRMQRALEEFIIEGIKTTIPFHLAIINLPEFRAAKLHTHFIEEYLDKIKSKSIEPSYTVE